MPSVEWNRRAWGKQHGWDHRGDEWSGMADHCGQPYQAWKQALVDTFIDPVPAGVRMLEIAPGHGRWTEYLAAKAGSLALVDINQRCLDACRQRFGERNHLTYHLNDGYSLAFLPEDTIDFVWSFDAFVHMDPPIIQGYLAELSRVLAPSGAAVLHHAGQAHWSLALAPVTRRLGRYGAVLQRLAGQHRLRDSGNRSLVSRRQVARWAAATGLVVISQTDRWGEDDQYTVAKYRDCLTVLRRP